MEDILKQVERHSKALRVLELIDAISWRLNRHQETKALRTKQGFKRETIAWYETRIIIDTAIKSRLSKYYRERFSFKNS